MNIEQKKQLYTLLSALREDRITDEQFTELDSLISSSPEAAKEYLLYIRLWTDLQFFKVASGDSSETYSRELNTGGSDVFLESNVWDALADYEKSAPAIKISKQEPQQELIQKVVYPGSLFNITKVKLFTIVVSAAAVLLLFLYIRFAPDRSGKEVVTLKQSIKAKWIDNGVPMVSGVRLMNTDPPFILGEGLAELHFDNGAKVIVESPAEFQILTGEQMRLNYGRIFVNIAGATSEFIVQTSQSKIVDVGTQFGVYTDMRGETELHVVQGKTILIAGLRDDAKKVADVTAGQARHVDINGNVRDIPFQDHHFVRRIDSESSLVWRGQNISLADIVGGGNGFGTGRQDYGILIDTGIPSDEPLSVNGHGNAKKTTGDSFHPVPRIPAVDGVFIPDGGDGKVTISSQGHLFKECPDTSSQRSAPIINGAMVKGYSQAHLMIGDKPYGTQGNPALFMHANAGITFDLNAIRSTLPGVSLNRFTSVVASPMNPYGYTGSNFDVWILVDGQVRFSKTNISLRQSFPVEVVLTEQDRFLTIAVTDGIEDQEGNMPRNHCDWCLFGRPELIIGSN